MNVLFTGLFPFWQCHLIAECNFLEEHLAAGDEVSILACDRMLRACDANLEMSRAVCMSCIGLRQSALEKISRPPRTLPLISSEARRRASLVPIPAFPNLQELQGFCWQGWPAGKDVVSSLATATGLPRPCPSCFPKLTEHLLRDYLAVGLTAQKLLARHQFERVYVFNGRFAAARAWVRACETAGVEYVTQERMGMPDRVLTVRNGSPHENRRFARLIQEFWEAHGQDPATLQEARDFYEERPAGKLTGWLSYVRGQSEGLVKDLVEEGTRCVAVFPSSEAEFAGVPEYFEGAAFGNQQQAYLGIGRALAAKIPEMRLILRIHPNSRHEKHAWWEEEEFKRLSNLVIVGPEEPVSSYELMHACEKTMVFMSSMGAEATYWGKPSIVLSNAMYRGAGVCHEPESVEEAVEMLANPHLPALPRERALAFGAFMRLGARKLPYSEALDHCKLSFKGQRTGTHPSVVKFLQRSQQVRPRVPRPLWKAWELAEWHRLRARTRGQFASPKPRI